MRMNNMISELGIIESSNLNKKKFTIVQKQIKDLGKEALDMSKRIETFEGLVIRAQVTGALPKTLNQAIEAYFKKVKESE